VEIWSASFYQAAVNGLTMSESVPRANKASECCSPVDLALAKFSLYFRKYKLALYTARRLIRAKTVSSSEARVQLRRLSAPTASPLS